MFFKKKEKNNEKQVKKTCSQKIDKYAWIAIIVLAIIIGLSKIGILPKEILSFFQK